MSWSPKPILWLYRPGDEPLRAYLGEILSQEGYTCAEHQDLDRARDLPETLAGRALVLLSASSLLPGEREAISDYVRRGGAALLSAPPTDLLDALSVRMTERPHKTYGTAADGYLRIAEHPWGAHHAGAVVQFHAPCALCRIEGARPLAWMAARKDECSPYPAAVELEVGQGRAVIFGFDLGRTIVLTRQGDPLRASTGPLAGRDGLPCYKPGQLFHGFLDPELRDVPQADVLADLLVGIVRGLTDPRLPIPRLWHFPGDSPALTLLDGDSDSFDWDCYEQLVAPAVERGIPYTLNLMPDHLKGLDRAQTKAWEAKGNDFQLHYWPGTMMPSIEDMARCVPEQQRLFEETFGRRSVGSRAHCVVWPGYTETAAILAGCGFRMETNYLPFRGFQYGYCGSARPGRFMTPEGRVLPISQQPTLFMDDPMSNAKSLLPARTAEQAYDIVTRYYEESAARYHGVICTCLHPVPYAKAAHFREVQPAMRRAVVDATLRHGLRAMSMRDWSAFHEARRGVELSLVGGQWQARAAQRIRDLTVHVPAPSGVRRQGQAWKAMTVSVEGGGTVGVPQA